MKVHAFKAIVIVTIRLLMQIFAACPAALGRQILKKLDDG